MTPNDNDAHLKFPSPEQITRFQSLFRGNPEKHFVRRDSGNPLGIPKPITTDDIARHLRGDRPSLLSVPTDKVGMSHFGVIDVDRHGDLAPVDWLALTRRVAELQLPLVVAKSSGGKGAWLLLFIKEPEGFPSSSVRQILASYAAQLGIPNSEIFPKQDNTESTAKHFGSPVNLPYFGEQRPAFDNHGDQLDLNGFLNFAERRISWGAILEMRIQLAQSKSSSSGPQQEQRSMSKAALRRIVVEYDEELLNAPEGMGNNMLNEASYVVARAFASGALEGTEESHKLRLLDIVTKKWKNPHDVQSARTTINSGWSAGITKPFKIANWRDKFHTGSQLAEGEIRIYIDRILPEGINAFGSLSGVGKTWFALSAAHALTTGEPFLGVYAVKEIVPVLYLVPENGERAFRKRLEKMHIPMNDLFFCQTMSDGVSKLDDKWLKEAIEELKPVVFLDTAVRFSESDDENSASQNAKLLASDLFQLIKWGAKAVVCLHHSPKASSKDELMTLENVLRGTGDLGAMCDAVWGLQHDKRKSANGKDWDYEYLEESQRLTRIHVRCVKPRDFEPAPPFRIQGKPYIDEKHDFVVLAEANAEDLEAEINSAIEKNSKISINKLRSQFGIGATRLEKLAGKREWVHDGKMWSKAKF
jgi:hypothetical protein